MLCKHLMSEPLNVSSNNCVRFVVVVCNNSVQRNASFSFVCLFVGWLVALFKFVKWKILCLRVAQIHGHLKNAF